jgi:hypothetical protein
MAQTPQFKAHPKHPAVDYLVRLHADIGGRIKVNRKEHERLAADMKHVEAVIRMFNPSYNIAAIVQRRRIGGNPYFKRGTLFREGLSVLRTAGRAMTAREIVAAMLAAKGITTATAAQIRTLRGGLTNSMRNNEGKAVERVGEGAPMRWRLKI